MALDQFGYPALWTIGLRRRLVDLERQQAAWTPAERRALAAATALVDGRAGAAHDILAALPDKGFAATWNEGLALRRLGRLEEADARLADARALDAERAARRDAAATSSWISVVLSYPLEIGGMRALVDCAADLRDRGSRVRLIQVRGGDRRDLHGFDEVLIADGPEDLTRRLAGGLHRAIVVGSWIDFVPALRARAGTVVSWCGGEPSLTDPDGLGERFRQYLDAVHRLPVPLVTISKHVEGIYRERFDRSCTYLPASIDTDVFRPGAVRRSSRLRVLLVGRDTVGDKGLDVALTALSALQRRGIELQIVWLSVVPPEVHTDVDGDIHFGCSKTEVGELYASCDVLVYPSRSEGLGLPPLEAMAAGVAVVTTNNGGSSEYVIDGVNCLVVPQGDVAAVEWAVERLAFDGELRRRLVANGRETVRRYDRAAGAAALDSTLDQIVSAGICADLPPITAGRT